MCTLTYLPLSDGFVVTSNRDESPLRATQLPEIHDHGDISICYPRDEVGGGTWIAADLKGRIACLLNGAFLPHKHEPPYRISRGQILLQALQHVSFNEFLVDLDLDGVEPFTLLLLNSKRTESGIEFRWTGSEKYMADIDGTRPQVWQSSSMYDADQQYVRQQMFGKWVSMNPAEHLFNISGFHHIKHEDNERYDILIDRDVVKTVSITQIHISGPRVIFDYLDLVYDRTHRLEFDCDNQ